MKKNHTVCVTFQCKPECAEVFEDLMQSVRTDLPNVAGCQGVRVLRHQDDALTYTLIEDWTEQERHEKHIQGLVASGAWANIEAMLAVAPTSNVAIDI